MSTQNVPPVFGRGFRPDGGGFAEIVIGGKSYPVRLIAAAPDLLEALVAITDQLERIGDTRQHKDGQFIDDARAAIAKATTNG